MNASAERSKSYWRSTLPLLPTDLLLENATADVAVIGSGMAGLSVAYELATGGRSVIVVDRGPLVAGMTSRTSAHLASHIDDGFHQLIKLRGLEEARLHYKSHAAAISRIEQIQAHERIDCDFKRVDGFLLRDVNTSKEDFEREYEASRKVELAAVEWLERSVLPRYDTGPAIRYLNQARFHPLRYAYGLIDRLLANGVRLYSETIVTSIDEDGDRVLVKTKNGPHINAGAAVVATNSPINDRVAIHTKQAPYRTYVFAAEVAKGAVPDALFWDTCDPYHYVRLVERADEGTDLVLVGGADHRSGETNDAEARFAKLEEWARKRLPEIGAITHRWSGQVMEPVDYAAFIGRNPGNKHVFVATGDSGQGLTHGAIAGMLIASLINGHSSPWEHIFDPRRRTVRATGEFVREQMPVVANLSEYATGGEVSSVDDVRPGEGAIVRQGLHKLAVYRAESGRLYVHSAACTHIGCIVHWNGFEKCWDCPCHGSQFAPDGAALNAPAIDPLSPASMHEESRERDKAHVPREQHR